MEELLLKFPSNESLSELININRKKELGSILQNAYKSDYISRKKVKLSKDEYINGSIQRLQECINCILLDENVPGSFNEYYCLVENNCKHGNFSKLYDMITVSLSEFWDKELFPMILPNLTSMVQFVECWNIWSSKLQKLKLIFLYLENNYLIYSKSKKTISEYGSELFSGSILKLDITNTGTRLYEPGELKTRYLIFGDFITVVQDYLRHNKILAKSIDEFIHIIKRLDFDQSIRFPLLIGDLLGKIFEDLEMNWITKANGDQVEINETYITDSLIQINAVKELLKIYFDESRSYSNSVFFKMHKFLIFDKVGEIYDKLMPHLIFHHVEEVSTLYIQFINWKQDLTKFADTYSRILQSKIIEIFEELDGDENLIRKLLIFKDECYQNFEIMFKGDEIFEMRLRDAFKKSLNSSRYSKIINDKLNKYIVQLLKNNDKLSLTRFQEIFKFIEDKELFRENYSFQLSRRLIFNKTELDLENYIISLLTNISGPDFTKSLEIMVQDILDSQKLTQEYFDNNQLLFEFSALTLNSFHWNKLQKRQDNNNVKFKIPFEFESVLSKFETYWGSKPQNKSKILKWFYHLNQLTLNSNFNGKEKQIFVNLLQGCILLLFNDTSKLSFQEIKIQLQLEQDQILINHLNSLTHGKYKLLISSTKEIKPNTIFELNRNFKSKSNIIKPSIVSSTPAAPTSSSSLDNSFYKVQSLEQEDKLRSLIVRIMKNEKITTHNSLINNMLTMVQVDTQLLKQMIEKLIDEEYIKRKGSDGYEYIP